MARKKSKRQKKFYGGRVDLGSNINLDGGGGIGRLNIGENATETTAGGDGRMNLTGVNNPTLTNGTTTTPSTTTDSVDNNVSNLVNNNGVPGGVPGSVTGINQDLASTLTPEQLSAVQAYHQSRLDGITNVAGVSVDGVPAVGAVDPSIWQNYINNLNLTNTTTTSSTDPAVREGVQSDLEAYASGEKTLSDATRITQERLIQDGEMPEGTITGPDGIQRIGEQADVTAGAVSTDRTIGVREGTASETAAPGSLSAAQMEAAQISAVPMAEAAQGSISQIVTPGQANYDPNLHGETISPEEIDAGKSPNIEGALSSGAFAEAAQGQASQFRDDTPQAAVKSRVAATIDDSDIAKGIEQKIDENGLPDLADVEIMPERAIAAVAELPVEALVTSQMNTLLAGMEDGNTPSWALPALSAVEQQLAARGMSASTVGRTQLFSAIVSAALPLAQGNAQALQQRAQQNLSNRQQANIVNAQLGTQAAVSEAEINSRQAAIRFQTVADIRTTNAQLAQQMTMANMSAENQVKLANLQALNDAGRDNLNAAQQTELANLQAELEVGTLNAQLAQQMGVANLNAAQQTAIYNATTQAGMDMANFSAQQQTALANSKWMQTATLTNVSNEQQAVLQEATLLAQQDLANADAVTRASIENARNFLQMDMTNLSNEQQASMVNQQAQIQKLLSNQSATNAARQFNAASDNQVNTFMANLATNVQLQNTAQLNAMEQFNAQQFNVAALQEAGMEAQAEQFNVQLDANIQQFNAQVDFQRDQWNAANAQAIEQSNVNWRRQANTADTAAANAINQQNAMNSFNLESSALSMLWQQLRDEAAFDQQSYIAYQTNATNLYATALSHENPSSTSFSKIDSIVKTFGAMMSGGT